MRFEISDINEFDEVHKHVQKLIDERYSLVEEELKKAGATLYNIKEFKVSMNDYQNYATISRGGKLVSYVLLPSFFE